MPDESPIVYWDEMHAPLGLGRRAQPEAGRRRGWPGLLAAATMTGALVGFAPLAWHRIDSHERVARGSVAGVSAHRERGAETASPRALAQDPGLRRAAATEGDPQLAALPAPPVETARRADPAAAETGFARPTALIINVAEALAAAKLKAAPR